MYCITMSTALKVCLFSFVAFFSLINIKAQDIKYINESEIDAYKESKIYTSPDSIRYLYTKPHPLKFIPNTFINIASVPSAIFKKENTWPIIGVVLSTGILVYYDQQMVDATQQFCRYIGLGTDNNTMNLSPSNAIPLYIPTSLPAALYYIGDGITELGINAGFYIYGYATNDIRALRTASELTEGISAVGVYIQVLKHLTGRETPMRATQPGGVWRLFPSLKEYHSSVPKYDAYPSGHLATAMVTTTIISLNYPEKRWIKPVAYSLIAICGFQMMNNGVHWASDYPLAIGLGYTIGKIAVNNGRKVVLKDGQTISNIKKTKYSFDVSPAYFGNGASGVSLTMKF